MVTRRSQCLEKARKPEPKAEYLGEVCQAASDTQKRMGIRSQETFRKYPAAADSGNVLNIIPKYSTPFPPVCDAGTIRDSTG
ncbi:TPA: PerC family transcriptional regulator [Salmonella enterica subsp. enterica serovar Hvittingfoss]|uniref:PerC family transcriptional regulator n=1 Tax=Salmonella enterica TaxID=28901 RepID=UPI002A1893C0|nr:PerC family transcriptional regulator [Salmonella enterica]